MFDIIKKFWKEYLPTKYAMYQDEEVIRLHIIGGGLIAFSFITIGICCFIYARKNELNPSITRIRLTNLFGLFITLCGSSRAFDILCIFHAYQVPNALLKIATGTVALITLTYLPFVISSAMKAKSLSDIQNEIERLQEKANQMEEVSAKLKTK